MAISAKFIADFSDFAQAVKTEEARLQAFTASAGTGMDTVKTHVDATSAAFGDMGGMVRSLATDLAAVVSVRAVFDFFNALVDEASALKNLSQQTHIGVEDLQILSSAMSEFGVDADTLGKGLFGLSRRIAGGDDSVARALAVMGISLKDVEGLNGEALFLKIEAGLATLQGGLRDTTASDLFGSKLGMAMAGASEGIQAAVDHAREFNKVVDTEANAALAAYGDAVKQAEKNLHAFASTAIGPALEGVNALMSAVNRGTSVWQLADAMAQDFFAHNLKLGTGTENLTRLLTSQNAVADLAAVKTAALAAAQGLVTTALDTRTQAERFMQTLEANSGVALEASQIKNLEHLKEIGQLNAANAEKIGVNAGQFAKYTAAIEAAKKAAADLATAQREADAVAMTSYQGTMANLKAIEAQRAKSYGTAEQLVMLGQLDAAEQALARSVFAQLNSEKERMKVIVDAGKQHEAITLAKMGLEQKLLGVVNAAVQLELTAQIQLNKAAGLDAQGAIAIQTSAYETLRLGLAELQKTAVAGISQKAQAQVLEDAYTASLLSEAIALDRATAAQAGSNTELGKVPALAKAAQAALESMAGGTKLPGSHTDPEFGQQYLIGPGGIRVPLGPHGELPKNWQELYSGKATIPIWLASGGPVTAGEPYMVGEQGPELFVPASSGSIVPHGASGGGSQTFIFNLYGTPASLVEQVKTVIARDVLQGRKVG